MTSKGTQAGEKARDAVSRSSREIRDAEPDPTDGYPAIIDFGDTFVEFTTTFNQSGNDQPLLDAHPHTVRVSLDTGLP